MPAGALVDLVVVGTGVVSRERAAAIAQIVHVIDVQRDLDVVPNPSLIIAPSDGVVLHCLDMGSYATVARV